MKRIGILLLLLLLTTGCLQAVGIVNNSTVAVSSEDSLSFTFHNLDSLGQNRGGLDTTGVVICYSNGAVAFSETISGVSGRVQELAVGNDTAYCYRALVADIDGDGRPGRYAVSLVAGSDVTGGWLKTPQCFAFQVVDWELDDMGAASFAALDSLGKTLDSVYRVMDSLYAILDTLQNQDDWVATAGSQSSMIANQLSLSNDHLALGYDIEEVQDSVNSSLDYLRQGYDSALIARSVWNTPQANHTNPATFGKYLDTEISGMGGGSGAYSYVLTAQDSTLGLAVPGASIAIRNLSQTTLLAVGRTDADGCAGFNLDAGSYLAVVTAAGYLFQPYDTFVVTGAGADSVCGIGFDPGTPGSASLCRVYGFLYDLTGAPIEQAVVSAGLPSGVRRSGAMVVSPFAVSAETDSTGYFFLDLIPSGLLLPEDSPYEITISTTDGTVLRRRLNVPDQASWQLLW